MEERYAKHKVTASPKALQAIKGWFSDAKREPGTPAGRASFQLCLGSIESITGLSSFMSNHLTKGHFHLPPVGGVVSLKVQPQCLSSFSMVSVRGSILEPP